MTAGRDRKLIELKVGDSVPAGAVFIRAEQRRGRVISENYVRTEGIFPWTRTIYQNVYEMVTFYIYEVPD